MFGKMDKIQLRYIFLYAFLALIGAIVTGIGSHVTNQTEDYQMFLVSSYYNTALCVKILGNKKMYYINFFVNLLVNKSYH